MRFALLGNHPDGLEMASALVETGRHQLLAYTDPVDPKLLQRWGPAQRVNDAEEALAIPEVEVVIVAGKPTVRAAQLQRALQSEHHVLCVCPPDQAPESAYQAAMIRDDTGRLLLPLLPEALHPAVLRLAELVRRSPGSEAAASSLGDFQLLELEWSADGQVLEGVEREGWKPAFPGWAILRRLGGEIPELFAFAEQEELLPGQPVVVAGRFEKGGLFRVTLLPGRTTPQQRLVVTGARGRAELLFPLGQEGPALLSWRDETGEPREEYWPRWDPWPTLVSLFETALDRQAGASVAPVLTWEDAIRSLELDDTARRSVVRRRSGTLEYQEASETVGFKGAMTMTGCGLVWLMLLLVILANWFETAKVLILPLLVVFLGLQLLRYLIPQPREP